MLDRPGTPLSSLLRARTIASGKGLHYVYLGNVRTEDGSTTFCPGCGAALIERDGCVLMSNRLRAGACGTCGRTLPGVFLRA
jgi:pyruvate formate lyase activating enzyme